MSSAFQHMPHPKTYDYMLSPPEERIEEQSGTVVIDWSADWEGDEPTYRLAIDWNWDGDFDIHEVRCLGEVTYANGRKEVKELPVRPAGEWQYGPYGLKTPSGVIARAFQVAYDSDESWRDIVRDEAAKGCR